MQRRDFVKWTVLQTAALSLSTQAQAQELSVLRREEPSILQGPTDESSTQFSILARTDDPFYVQAMDSQGRIYRPEHISGYRGGENGWEVTFAAFKRLPLSELFRLELVSIRTRQVIESREFHLAALNAPGVRFAVVSCMDDSRHEPGIWNDLFAQNPDAIFFIGDSVYADKVNGVYGPADPAQLWTRFCEARRTLGIYYQKKLIPVYATWDDHDFGANDTGLSYPWVKESQVNFRAFYPQYTHYCRGLFTGPGIASGLRMSGQQFLLLDDRSFRDDERTDGRYGHWGQAQEEWILEQVSHFSGPTWLMNGSQFFPYVIWKESVSRNHPQNFAAFLESLKATNKRVVFMSGDVHYSEISEIEGETLNYPTLEITSSSVHSVGIPGFPHIIPNPRRSFGLGQRNYVLIESQAQGLGIRLTCRMRSSGKLHFEKNFEV